MKNEKLLYQLMNDLLRYLLKYGNVRTFSEEQAAEALTESERICEKYRKSPNGIGWLAWQLFSVVNAYFAKREAKQKGEKGEKENT